MQKNSQGDLLSLQNASSKPETFLKVKVVPFDQRIFRKPHSAETGLLHNYWEHIWCDGDPVTVTALIKSQLPGKSMSLLNAKIHGNPSRRVQKHLCSFWGFHHCLRDLVIFRLHKWGREIMICVRFCFQILSNLLPVSPHLEFLDYFSYLVVGYEVVGSNPGWCVTFLAENIPVLSGRLVSNFSLTIKLDKLKLRHQAKGFNPSKREHLGVSGFLK